MLRDMRRTTQQVRIIFKRNVQHQIADSVQVLETIQQSQLPRYATPSTPTQMENYTVFIAMRQSLATICDEQQHQTFQTARNCAAIITRPALGLYLAILPCLRFVLSKHLHSMFRNFESNATRHCRTMIEALLLYIYQVQMRQHLQIHRRQRQHPQ